MNYADKLHQLAYYLQDRPELLAKFDEWYDCPREYIYAKDWEEFQSLIAVLNGYTKDGYAGSLEASHTYDTEEGHIYRVRVSVSNVCEQVPKVDEDGEPVMEQVTRTEYVPTGEERPVYEWKCPPVWSS